MGVGIAVTFALGGCSVRVAARREAMLDSARERAPSIAAVLGAGDATALERPERFAGLHWFNPPELVELVEVVGTSRTGPAVLEALYGWMETLGKAPAAVRRDVPGFVANRVQYALLREAWALVEAGVCSYADLDRVLTRGLGARWAAIGPFQTVDLAGLDIHLAVAENLFPELSNERAAPRLLAETVANGALGTKSGHGLLGTYGPEDRERLVARRDRMLQAVAHLHLEGDEPVAPE